MDRAHLLAQAARTREATREGRRAVVLWWLCHGESLTTEEVSILLHVSKGAARDWLYTVSATIPIYNDWGTWCVCARRELDV